MYLTHLSAELAKMAKQALETPEGKEAYERLAGGAYEIYWSLARGSLALTYEAYAPSLPLLGLTIEGKKGISSPYGQEIGDAERAFLCYLRQREAADGEEALRKRYGRHYDELQRAASFTPAEAKAYAEGKERLSDLIEDLRRLDEPETETHAPHLLFSLRRLSGRSMDLHAVIRGEKDHEARSLSSFLRQVHNDALLSDGKGAYLHLGIENWDEADQKAIFYLSSFPQDGPELGYGTGECLAPTHVVDILSHHLGKALLIEGEPYAIAPSIPTIRVQLDENGALVAEGADKKHRYYFGAKAIMAIDNEERQVRFYAFASLKEKHLFEFMQENPRFPYENLQEEISSSLLPLLQRDVQIDEGFQRKSEAYRTFLAYYLTYEDDQEAPCLKFETKFLSRGYALTKEEYLEFPGNVYEDFTHLLEEYQLPENGVVSNEEEIGRILDLDLSALSKLVSLYLSDNIKKGVIVRNGVFKVNANSGLDWFELKVESPDFNAEEVNAILKAYRKKKKYVRIGERYYAADDEEMAALVRDFLPEEEGRIGHERLPLYKALKLHSSSSLHLSVDQALKDLFDDLLHYSAREVPLAQSLLSALRPYQLDAVKWMHCLASHHLGGILADDMGLGKSLETIAFLSTLPEEKPILIVSPKSLIYNWKAEFAKWNASQRVEVLDGTKASRKAQLEGAAASGKVVYVVSYDSLRNDEALFTPIPFGTVILDEAQYIANAHAKKSKAVKEIQADHRYVLTGTPIQNSFMDLWSIMDFLLPSYLEDYREFHSLYAGLSDAKEAEIKKLESEIAPFLLRRTKEEVLKDLPPKEEEVQVVAMEEKEKRLYRAYFENAKLALLQQKEDKRKRIALLAEITRLRQLCVDPTTFLRDFEGVSTKLERALAIIQNALSSGHKVLLFSSFVEVLKHLQALLSEQGIPSSLIYGDTPAKERIGLAEDFNKNPASRVMLVSLKAGGTGLNLIGADIVIHIDPWWNLAAENQASDRAHRIGQTRPVTVYKLVAKDTIEEKIIELQLLKKSLTDILRVSDGEGNGLTAEDIAFLLS